MKRIRSVLTVLVLLTIVGCAGSPMRAYLDHAETYTDRDGIVYSVGQSPFDLHPIGVKVGGETLPINSPAGCTVASHAAIDAIGSNIDAYRAALHTQMLACGIH